jgi:hypothetical protein
MAVWQGPALLCFNDAVFSPADFHNISRIGQDSKLTKPSATGAREERSRLFGCLPCSANVRNDLGSALSLGLHVAALAVTAIFFLDPAPSAVR